MSIRLACDAFVISQSCYRYTAKLLTDSALIADWLVRLTHNQRNWGYYTMMAVCLSRKE